MLVVNALWISSSRPEVYVANEGGGRSKQTIGVKKDVKTEHKWLFILQFP